MASIPKAWTWGASALRAYAWNLKYADALTADVPPEWMAKSAGPGLENHPAWTVGHLITGSNLLAGDLGLPDELPEGWADLFERRGPGDPRLPDPDLERYPPREALLAELHRQHARVAAAWAVKPMEEWAVEEAWALSADLPVLADATLFLAVSHEAMHLGQLAAWRRAMGLPSALAMLAGRNSDR